MRFRRHVYAIAFRNSVSIPDTELSATPRFWTFELVAAQDTQWCRQRFVVGISGTDFLKSDAGQSDSGATLDRATLDRATSDAPIDLPSDSVQAFRANSQGPSLEKPVLTNPLRSNQ